MLAHELLALAVGEQGGQVAQVDDADHVVDALAEHRQARAPRGDGGVQGLAHRGVGRDVHHVDARHHDLAHDGVAELDDAADELALVALDGLVLVGHVGHGEHLVLGHLRHPVRAAEEEADDALGHREQELGEPLDGPEVEQGLHHRRGRQGRGVGVLHGEVLGDGLEDDEDDHHFAHRRDEQARRAEEPRGEHAHHGGRHQLADQHQQQQRVEEALGGLGERHQRGGAAVALLVERARPRLVHAHERGLGHGEEAREEQQDGDGDRERGVAAAPDGGDHVASPR